MSQLDTRSHRNDDGGAKHPMRVLLADNHRMFREALTIALKDILEEPEIVQVASTEEALSLLDESSEFEMVVLALRQHSNSDLDDLAKFRERVPAAHIIVLSDSQDIAALKVAIASGVDGFLLKGASIELLRQAIRMNETKDRYTLVPKDIAKMAVAENDDDAELNGQQVFGKLTKRQDEVLHLIENGFSNKQIAKKLGLLEGTVKVHVRDIMRKLGAKNRTQAAVLATLRHR